MRSASRPNLVKFAVYLLMDADGELIDHMLTVPMSRRSAEIRRLMQAGLRAERAGEAVGVGAVVNPPRQVAQPAPRPVMVQAAFEDYDGGTDNNDDAIAKTLDMMF